MKKNKIFSFVNLLATSCLLIMVIILYLINKMGFGETLLFVLLLTSLLVIDYKRYKQNFL